MYCLGFNAEVCVKKKMVVKLYYDTLNNKNQFQTMATIVLI